ncbi:hypothetical protein AVEN_260066-1 [Araneus ventricosus]|uniref:Uncharacterized protein n=1 Tax=Araneus ventricosus TaxID=182803 RepID=A0A4Y2G238_ARAVE|nr:hypothetical protein AVEN_260066-1 [Araneus ventricosus]
MSSFGNINLGKYFAWQRVPRLDEFCGVLKTCKVWPQKSISPAATPSFAEVNPRQPFIPKPPVNLIITIPNFSGVCPPDVFVFRNSSAKSVKFTPSAPASVFPQSSCLSANNVRSRPMKSNETEINDDIQYLYTVQTKGGELVEVVDLLEDSECLKLVKTMQINEILTKVPCNLEKWVDFQLNMWKLADNTAAVIQFVKYQVPTLIQITDNRGYGIISSIFIQILREKRLTHSLSVIFKVFLFWEPRFYLKGKVVAQSTRYLAAGSFGADTYYEIPRSWQ